MAQDDTIDELIEDRNELSSKALQLEKKLEIATNALEEIRDDMTSNDVYNDVPCDISEEALKQIQEVK